MERVTGIGGVFFKAKHPDQLRAWYAQHLGLKLEDFGACVFHWAEDNAPGKMTVWSIFPADTDYFAPSNAGFMINFRVKNLTAMLQQLSAAGIETTGQLDDEAFGRFAWILDPEGNKVELWQPPDSAPEQG